jgi:lipopolysaccharide transport system permease protein
VNGPLANAERQAPLGTEVAVSLPRRPTSAYELIIEANRRDRYYWEDLWRYRELFRVLAWRDLAVRYKQTVIGVAWALIRPLLSMLVFTIVFGRIAGLPSQGAPYALLVFAGTLPWMLFASGLADASNSLLSNANLISKVYFPRLIIPSAAMMVSLVEFLVSLGILAALMLWYRYPPGWAILSLPVFVGIAFFTSLGPALWIASLNVKYRDFRYVIPFILQLGLFISPVGFSSAVIPERWRLLYSMNPMVGIIDGFRWSILGGENYLNMVSLVLSIGVTSILVWLGIRQFRKTERSFADLI